MDKRLLLMGKRVDQACDSSDEGVLLNLIDEFDKLASELYSTDQLLAYYFQSNVYECLDDISQKDQNYFLDWEREYHSSKLSSLRKAKRHDSFRKLDEIRQCQILTNTGNSLNSVGRSIDAIEQYNQALEINPDFAMALGARSFAYEYYARTTSDPGHVAVMMLKTYEDISAALSPCALWDATYPDTVKQSFEKHKLMIEEGGDLTSVRKHLGEIQEKYCSYGDTQEEQLYRKWRVDNRLFLNPLNDFFTDAFVAYDILNLPSHKYEISNYPAAKFVEYFDVIKQEFISACLLLFEGLFPPCNHYADKDVLLFKHDHGELVGVNFEKQKASFRLSYSVLDKIAVFLNEYLDLRKKPKRVSISRLWFKDGKLHSRLPVDNFRLRGLYSLSQDIFDKEQKIHTEPDSKRIHDVRNAAEHRFLTLHLDSQFNLPDDTDSHVRVRVTEFESIALRMLKFARTAMIQLQSAMIAHERITDTDDIKSITITGVPRTQVE